MDLSSFLIILALDLLVLLPAAWYFMRRVQKLESGLVETKIQLNKSVPASRRRRS